MLELEATDWVLFLSQGAPAARASRAEHLLGEQRSHELGPFR